MIAATLPRTTTFGERSRARAVMLSLSLSRSPKTSDSRQRVSRVARDRSGAHALRGSARRAAASAPRRAAADGKRADSADDSSDEGKAPERRDRSVRRRRRAYSDDDSRLEWGGRARQQHLRPLAILLPEREQQPPAQSRFALDKSSLVAPSRTLISAFGASRALRAVREVFSPTTASPVALASRVLSEPTLALHIPGLARDAMQQLASPDEALVDFIGKDQQKLKPLPKHLRPVRTSGESAERAPIRQGPAATAYRVNRLWARLAVRAMSALRPCLSLPIFLQLFARIAAAESGLPRVRGSVQGTAVVDALMHESLVQSVEEVAAAPAEARETATEAGEAAAAAPSEDAAAPASEAAAPSEAAALETADDRLTEAPGDVSTTKVDAEELRSQQQRARCLDAALRRVRATPRGL